MFDVDSSDNCDLVVVVVNVVVLSLVDGISVVLVVFVDDCSIWVVDITVEASLIIVEESNKLAVEVNSLMKLVRPSVFCMVELVNV